MFVLFLIDENVFISVVVQEEGARKVFVYLNIPELKVKRSFPNVLKLIPSNGHEKIIDFQNQYELDLFDFLLINELFIRSMTYTIDVQKKTYSLAIARLPGEIQPERCSIKV